jgi:26S proteasome regulatory subunit N2
MFAYPPPVTTETKDTGAKVPKAVLSTTAKAKDKAKKKDAEKALKEGRSTADQDKDTSVKPEGDSALHCSPSESGLFTWSPGQV